MLTEPSWFEFGVGILEKFESVPESVDKLVDWVEDTAVYKFIFGDDSEEGTVDSSKVLTEIDGSALVPDINGGFIDNVGSFFSTAIETVTDIISGIGSAIVSGLGSIASGIAGAVSGAISGIGSFVGGIVSGIVNFFDGGNSGSSTGVANPVTLDLDGDGIELVGYDESGVFFDIDGDGYLEKTGWVGA